jgi:hypothetical protein
LAISSLSPVLIIGFTVEYFSLERKEPVSRDLLQMYVKGELVNGALHLRLLTEISSYPYAFFVFNDFIIFSVSLVDVYLNLIPGYGCLQFRSTVYDVMSLNFVSDSFYRYGLLPLISLLLFKNSY